MDRTTEAIAHFIGLFETITEAARLREAYDEFAASRKAHPDVADLPLTDTSFDARYDFVEYDPGLAYRAPAPQWVLYQPWSNVEFRAPEIPVDGVAQIAYPGFVVPGAISYSGSGYTIVVPHGETIGSVANYISQNIALSDDDYFGVGGNGLLFSPDPVDGSRLDELTQAAAGISPLGEVAMPGSAEDLTSFVTNSILALEEFEPQSSPGTTIFVEQGDTIEGTFVNGEKVAEAPSLEDYFDFDEEVEEQTGEHESEHEADTDHPSSVHKSDGEFKIEVSVEIETGDNTLVNNAVLKNFWTGAPVTAVVGDHFELNAIIQINAWCDNDYVTSAVGGWLDQSAPNEAFNIATFERFDPGEDDEAPEDDSGFPQHWVVKEISGNLMIVNWLQQLTFMTDNDIGVVSSSGVTTRVSSGDNVTYNDISIEEIGFSYDLIIIGGSVYDANIIHQMNVLCDSDLIGAVAGFTTTGEGSVSTHDNLLWNQAYIYNVGGAARFESLPDYYRETAEQLAEGQDYLADAVLSDSPFAGFGPLKVLYIKGDLINVQYVKQTNLLGDSDQVALAMHESDPTADGEWSVTTGANALLNVASILDLDSLGITYVGGEEYSGEILIQADIISTDPEFGGQDPDVLVNEAIAFLDDEIAKEDQADDGSAVPYDVDNGHSDGLQSLIG